MPKRPKPNGPKHEALVKRKPTLQRGQDIVNHFEHKRQEVFDGKAMP